MLVARAVTLMTLLAVAGASAQIAPDDARVMAAVVDALKAALPYPSADEHDLPVDGNTTALWLVSWPAPGETRIDVIANPLNEENQARANKADAEIQRAVMAAQQKAQTLYDRAVAEFEKTGRTDPIEGITLGDEGVSGERIDASNRVVVTVTSNQKEYRLRVRSSVEPTVSSIPDASIIRVAANVYRERSAPGEIDTQHYHASEAHVLFGAAAAPSVTRTAATAFEIVASATASRPTVMVSVQGNDTMVEQIVSKANWTALAAFMRQ